MSREPDSSELENSRRLSAELADVDEEELAEVDEVEVGELEVPAPEDSLVLSRRLSVELDELGDDDLDGDDDPGDDDPGGDDPAEVSDDPA